MKEKSKRNSRTSQDFFQGLFVGVVSLILITFLALFFANLFLKKQLPKQPPSFIKAYPKISRGQIAIIIDDNGYSSDSCSHIKAISQPVAISILPYLPFSRTVAVCAYKNRKEVLLHLPLEPTTYTEIYPPGYVITTVMTKPLIEAKLSAAIQNIPHVVGINNHMGSKATEDVRTMSLIFATLKKRNLFFVDSRVSTKSVVPAVAQKSGVSFTQRDIFLDNETDRNYIEGQFFALAQEAEKKGYAVGIGHARPLTWTIVREQLSKLQKKGFRIVTVKEIVQFESRERN